MNVDLDTLLLMLQAVAPETVLTAWTLAYLGAALTIYAATVLATGTGRRRT